MEVFADKMVSGTVGWAVGFTMGLAVCHYWSKIRLWLAAKLSKGS